MANAIAAESLLVAIGMIGINFNLECCNYLSGKTQFSQNL